MTSGCQSLDSHWPGSGARGGRGDFSLGLVPLPAPPVPVTLKHWRENTEYQMQSTETTTKHGKSQMLWRNGDHTVHRQVGPTSTSTHPDSRTGGRRRTPCGMGYRGRQQGGGTGARAGWCLRPCWVPAPDSSSVCSDGARPLLMIRATKKSETVTSMGLGSPSLNITGIEKKPETSPGRVFSRLI